MNDSLPLFPEQLAQSCASSSDDSCISDLKRFADLQEEARKCAKVVTATDSRHHEAAWGALLPVLDKMQKLLSQRGANHKDAAKGLPEWGFWWHDFSRRNHLGISFRTVQYRLSQLRRAPSSGKRHRLRATPKEQLELAATAMAGHRLAGSYSMGRGSIDDVKIFYRESLPLGTVKEIVERLSAMPPRNEPSDPLALAKAIVQAAGPRIRECLEGLSSEDSMEALQLAFSSIIEKFCPGTGISVNVECSTLVPRAETARLGISVGQDAA